MATQALAEQCLSLAAVTRHTFLELQLVDADNEPVTLRRRDRVLTDSFLAWPETRKPRDEDEDERPTEAPSDSDASSAIASWASDDEDCLGMPSRASSPGCSGRSACSSAPRRPPGSFVAPTQRPAPASSAAVCVPVAAPAPQAPQSAAPLRRQKVEPWRQPGVAPVREDERTTLVLKRLPEGCTRARLVELLNAAGFLGKFDFVYIPAHFKTWTLFRYAFVNFSSCAEASHALQELQGQLWPGAAPEDGLEVSWSEVHQGLELHVERYRNSPLMHALVPDEYKPIFLRHGLRVRFPRPSQRLVPPRSLPGRPSSK